MMFTKKTTVRALFIIGVILIILSTFNFSYKIPDLEREIVWKENLISIRNNNFVLFKIHRSRALNAFHQGLILTEINPNSPRIEKLYLEFMTAEMNAMGYLRIASTGMLPDQKLMDEWGAMDHNQLLNEFARYTEDNNLNELIETRDELKEKMRKLESISIAILVLGLILNQIAIILQITWLED